MENNKKIQDSCQSLQTVVIPRSIPNHIYITLEDFKCEKYGGLWSQMDKQVAFVDGQCATIELIEEWLRSL